MDNIQNIYLVQANICLEKFYDPNFSINQRQTLAEFIQSNLKTNIPIPNVDVNRFSNEMRSLLQTSLEQFNNRLDNYNHDAKKGKVLDILKGCCQHPDFFKLWDYFFNHYDKTVLEQRCEILWNLYLQTNETKSNLNEELKQLNEKITNLENKIVLLENRIEITHDNRSVAGTTDTFR